jgi:hypothetical protein
MIGMKQNDKDGIYNFIGSKKTIVLVFIVVLFGALIVYNNIHSDKKKQEDFLYLTKSNCYIGNITLNKYREKSKTYNTIDIHFFSIYRFKYEEPP